MTHDYLVGLVTGAPAERAAALSARIHGELNAGRSTCGMATFDLASIAELDVMTECFDGAPPWQFDNSPFARLGAELRAIVLGNREGRR